MTKYCWVEVIAAQAVQIFRTKKAAVLFSLRPSHGIKEPIIVEMERAEAVRQIRWLVFNRDEFQCVHCGRAVVWERGFPNSGEMDEKQARGDCKKQADGRYLSGQISFENSRTLGRQCHTGKGGKQDRSPFFHKAEQG